jgi:hypothetical protein
MPAAHRPLDGSAGARKAPKPWLRGTSHTHPDPSKRCTTDVTSCNANANHRPQPHARGIFCCHVCALRNAGSRQTAAWLPLQGLCVWAGRRRRNASGGGAARGRATTGCGAAAARARATGVLLLLWLPPHCGCADRCQRGSLVAAAALRDGVQHRSSHICATTDADAASARQCDSGWRAAACDESRRH